MTDKNLDGATAPPATPTDPDAGKTPEQIQAEVWEERDQQAAGDSTKGKADHVPAAEPESGTPPAPEAASDAGDPTPTDEPEGTPDEPEAGTTDGHDADFWEAAAKRHQAGFTRVSQELAEIKKAAKERDREVEILRAKVSAYDATAKEFGTEAEASEAVQAAAAATEKDLEAAAEKERALEAQRAERLEKAGQFAQTFLTQRYGEEWLTIPQDPQYTVWASQQDPNILARAEEYDAYALDILIRDFKAYKETLSPKPKKKAAEAADPSTKPAPRPPMGGSRPGKIATPEAESDSADDVWSRTSEEHRRRTQEAIRKFDPAMRRKRAARA